ncbi:vWA domain-containing protein [Aeoliella sp. SH292]|uniref:vWA domain-containing protein n=1 Tax=Aeoliella sp. SH292 TaxID=3454464 RepID=UPI003F9DBE1C
MSQEFTNSNSASDSSEWRDRLVDRALAERLGGDAPPDLTARILAAAEPSSLASSHGDKSMDSQSSSRRSSARTWVLAASLLLNCGLVATLLIAWDKDRQTAMNQQQNNLGAIQGAFDSQDPIANREFETAARTEGAGIDTSKVSDLEIAAATAGGRVNLNAHGDGKQFTTDSYEIKPAAPITQLERDEVRVQVVPDGNIGLQGLIDNPNPVISSPSRRAPLAISPSTAKYDELVRLKRDLRRAYQGQEGGQDGLSSLATSDGKALSDGSDDPQAIHRFAGAAGQGQAAEPGEILDANDPVHFGVEVSLGRDRSGEAERLKEQGTHLGYAFQSSAAPPRNYDHTAMYSQLMDARGDVRLKWGFQSNGRKWPGGQPWHGSPDGQGIGPDASGDKYDLIVENDFIPAIGGEAVSTFSIDVDTASYANVRQMLRNSQVPPADAVRLEEFVNYFDYDYEPPKSDEEAPFAAHVETAACPWQPAHRLVRIGIKGRELAPGKRPLSNLVFLVDVSGSMNEVDKLPLVVHGLKKLTDQLGENDRVAIVVYASSEGLVLPSTPGTEKEKILAALDSLAAGGSTAGGAGIQLAYQIAEDNFIEGGTNRVILCTDGDFNVGTTSTAELERMVEQKAKDTKVFLSCIGFGRGNLNDAMMENITGIGNGNYYYADGEQESERIFVKGMTGMLVTIAKDVKIQVEFNPAKVAGYRLLGYENRVLATQDFNDDKKDAGEIGAGHTVTCLYEIVPTGEEVEAAKIDELKYQRPAGLTDKADTDELLTLKMRYKKPDGDTSTKLEWPVADSGHKFGEASTDMQFAAAVASFGMLLRDSQYKGDTSYDAVIEIAESAKGKDPEGERAEFVELVRAAKKLKPVVSEENTEEKEPAPAQQK